MKMTKEWDEKAPRESQSEIRKNGGYAFRRKIRMELFTKKRKENCTKLIKRSISGLI